MNHSDEGPPALSRAWGMLLIATLVYFYACVNRSGMAVAGLLAIDRFDITNAQLATFTMVQLLVYALMQIPVGLLVDRWGPRAMLLTGASVMTLGQVAFAFANGFGSGLAARAGIGIGDSMIFISLLRVVASWFPGRRQVLVTQVASNIGQLGTIAAALPMTWALSQFGWTKAYLIVSVIGPLAVLLAIFALHDRPGARKHRGIAVPLRGIARAIGTTWRQPGTRLGFFIHFTTPFSATTLSLLWGYPFLVEGEGLSSHAASALLTVMTVVSAGGGFVVGFFVARHPWHRSTFALSSVTATALAWTVVLGWPGHAPVWVLLLQLMVAAVGGPASMIAFDVGRTSNPAERLSSASGVINQAGWVASLVSIFVIGLLLDWRTPAGHNYTHEAFVWAMSFQYVLWAFGAWGLWHNRRLVRRLVPRDRVEAGDSMVEFEQPSWGFGQRS